MMKRIILFLLLAICFDGLVRAQDANQAKISKAEDKVSKSEGKLLRAKRDLEEADSLYTLAGDVKKSYEDTLSQLADEDKELRRDYFNTSRQAQKEAREVGNEGLDSLRGEYKGIEKDFTSQFKELDRRFKQAYRGLENAKRDIEKAKEKQKKARSDIKAAEREVKDSQKALERVKKDIEKKLDAKAKREQKKAEEKARKAEAKKN